MAMLFFRSRLPWQAGQPSDQVDLRSKGWLDDLVATYDTRTKNVEANDLFFFRRRIKRVDRVTYHWKIDSMIWR